MLIHSKTAVDVLIYISSQGGCKGDMCLSSNSSRLNRVNSVFYDGLGGGVTHTQVSDVQTVPLQLVVMGEDVNRTDGQSDQSRCAFSQSANSFHFQWKSMVIKLY